MIQSVKNNLAASKVFYFKISEDKRKIKNIFLYLLSVIRIIKGGKDDCII